ncbi:hypothetical protein OsI_03519 [Oryza sativa Indica Group]|nr:hypothetical protein OsI_03519 [Oryza sativa Indica Group]
MTVKARVTSSCADVEASQLTSRTLLTLRLADRTKPDDEPHNANGNDHLKNHKDKIYGNDSDK